jgi:predicted GIY-YIG superfamily endonuclease
MRNHTFYMGQSADVGKRIQQHADGSGSRHARQLKDFFLVFVEGPMDRVVAVQRERQLKKWSRAKKIALIQNDVETLKILSKSSSTSNQLRPLQTISMFPMLDSKFNVPPGHSGIARWAVGAQIRIFLL